MGSVVYKYGLEKHRMKMKRVKSRLRSVKRGGKKCGKKYRSANLGRGAPNGIEECYPSGGAPNWGW